MPRSSSSWNASASCRLEWRPSRLLGAMLWGIGALAMCSVLASGLPVSVIAVLVPLVGGYTVWIAHRHRRALPRHLVILGGDSPPMLDGVVLVRCDLQWRGPLAFLAWRDADSRRGHLVWWPDTLDARQRRELRLAVDRRPVSAHGVAMAP